RSIRLVRASDFSLRTLKLARRPGAAPGRLSFGDSVAQAGARRRYWCGCRELHPDILRGGETFWLLNHSRKESKRAGSNHAPGPCYFNKEQTPLGDLLDPNPRFHGGSFGV